MDRYKKLIKFFTFVTIIISVLFLLGFKAEVKSTFKNNSYTGNKQQLPVLMYHIIGKSKGSTHIVSYGEFCSQMAWLFNNGYTTPSEGEINSFINGKRILPKKSVVLTFDDGYKQCITNVLPILKKYNFSAFMFIVVDRIGSNKYLNIADIKKLYYNHIYIGSHTLNHLNLTKLNNTQLCNEIYFSKYKLESSLGFPVKYFSYPFGKYNKKIISIVNLSNYRLSFTTKSGMISKGDNNLLLKRIEVHPWDNLNRFKRYFKSYN